MNILITFLSNAVWKVHNISWMGKTHYIEHSYQINRDKPTIIIHAKISMKALKKKKEEEEKNKETKVNLHFRCSIFFSPFIAFNIQYSIPL